MNIPNVTVDEMIHCLKHFYCANIRKRISLKCLQASFLWGAAGIGKSQGVFQFAEEIERECNVKVCVTDVRLLLFSPIDLRGVPVADVERKFATWLMPKIFAMDDSEGVINILFLDELSAAPQSVQAAAYQLCLDKKVGEHSLPDNCIVIAAGNRTTDQSISYKMPKALCNRFMHFNVSGDNFPSWKKWAVGKGIDYRIVSYLAFDNSRLCVEPEASDLAFTTPRSWEFVSNVIEGVEDLGDTEETLIAANIGCDAAHEFISFCKGVLQMPSVEEILAGKCREYPKSHDVMYALMSAVVYRIKSSGATLEELENLCDYCFKLPGDYVACMMSDLAQLEGINEKLMRCHGFKKLYAR